IAGRATDEHREPLAGVSVFAQSDRLFRWRPLAADQLRAFALPGEASDMAPESAAHSDAAGAFELAVLPDTSPQYVTGSLAGYVGVRSQPVVVAAADARAFVELALRRGGSIRGTITCNGKPWRGDVLCRQPGSGAVLGGASIDASGNYELKGVAPGD